MAPHLKKCEPRESTHNKRQNTNKVLAPHPPYWPMAKCTLYAHCPQSASWMYAHPGPPVARLLSSAMPAKVAPPPRWVKCVVMGV